MITLIPKAKPKVLIVLTENLCYKGNEIYLLSHFLQPNNIKPTDIAFFSIPSGKLKKADINNILPLLHECITIKGIDTIAICSSELFTYITKNKQFTLNIGNYKKGTVYSFKNKGEPKIELDFTNINIIPVLNPIVLNKFPNKVTLVNKGLSVIKTAVSIGLNSLDMKTNYLKQETLIKDANTLIKVLKNEFYSKALFIDVETTGLNWYKDKLLTISFTTNGSSAYCIAIHKKYHSQKIYQQMKQILKRFFLKYQGELIGHNWVGFDQTFITHEIMRDSNFNIEVAPIINKFNLQDTMFMAYLLYNSTERPSIGLKNLAFKYLGDWDKDIDQKNLINIPLEKIAHYNNLDVIATYLIYHELKKDIEQEHFEKPYKNWLKYGKQLLKMKMIGLRIDKEQTKLLKNEIYKSMLKDKQDLAQNEKVIYAMECLTKEKEAKEPLVFNPNSFIHKGYLFFEVLNLPPVAYSKKTKNPTTDKKSLDVWLKDDKVPKETKEILNLIMEIGLASKIHSTYLKNMLEGAIEVLPNDWRIFAEFNQTSTITGRLSSSGIINMQTIPSNSKYGSVVKKLFIAPDGYILGTIDFGSLEDRLVANASKDPKKCNIFLKGIDGHCLNAYAYYKEELKSRGLDYDINDPKSINKLAIEAGDLRQSGKSKTFALNYLAGASTVGAEAYDNYWELYKVLHHFNNMNIKKATRQGYLISKYSGIRLKLASINALDEQARAKETRVAVNFVTQSGNILMLEALAKEQNFLEQEQLTKKVQLCNTVHDSQYFYIKRDFKLIEKINNIFISIMTQNYIEDQIVPLTATLEIGDNMKQTVEIPNNSNVIEIQKIITEHYKKLKKEK